MESTKYIYVNGEKIYVSDEIYKVYKKQKNREEYLRRLDVEFLDFSFAENYSIKDIEDKRINVEKIVETNLLIDQLQKAMETLSDDEREIIKRIYFDDESLRKVAKSRNVSHPSLIKKRDRILKKLREMIGK
jgi:sigma factor|nr:sigma-70 family RNA polymerase sigma factor [uncultured Lachnoanaerobaculum sp.]